MKKMYFSLMKKALAAYTDARIVDYFERVKKEGLTEHGFPRLTANIGILISHGVRTDLLPLFAEMMDFCCQTIPKVKAANDFSVREIMFCLLEVEGKGILPKQRTDMWREQLASIDPHSCYSVYATAPTDDVRNWALFTAVSEYARQKAGMGASSEFIDLQIASQLQWIDDNGMYMDNKGSDIQHPMMYDIVSRGLFTLLLHLGYRGKYYERIDACLKKAALLTLNMQSVTGELAFGGRSNQFLHNEAWLSAIFEYEAGRYKKDNPLLAGRFKAAALRAASVAEEWFLKIPVRHIKNLFPTDSRYGCEFYAYFDKYMITVASFFYVAYMICDEDIPVGEFDVSPMAWQSSDHFHKVFLRAGGYALELDTNADPKYDACGLGRVHKIGAPSAICMSTPCPAQPEYTVDIAEPFALSLCPGVQLGDEVFFASGQSAKYDVLDIGCDQSSAYVTFACRFLNGRTVISHCKVDKDGVEIQAEGEGELLYMLPAFCFDGENNTDIVADNSSLEIFYGGRRCRYATNATVADLGKTAANRNGHYRTFFARANSKLSVRIEII